ncbi:MAG: UDP-N-acetylmuramoyl-L-alanyl-D-glutamate--2,6-diaminopimelate ligase [Clostridia bacterium]|jgi:UDP-N-acetylmuramoyl-L-alanyl-D-glutamate--2,6-diaminopimelate ligase|nr:UDP-N-acetylmuramoyl-L-alanyl-D-glutamate--2,6-diaminopimelate ligase [Clostridia bacterium]
MLSLKVLLKMLPEAQLLSGNPDQAITGLHYDSRFISPGSLFVCIAGLMTDGHLFASEAINKGAVALVVQRSIEVPAHISLIKVPDTRKALAQLAAVFFGHPSEKFNLFGITGTNGKTSTTILLEAIFKHWGKKTGLLGTIVNRIGEEVLPATHTTPESLELQKLFSAMAKANTEYVMMEVSSHALSLNRVEETEFDVALFTNLTRDHLDFHRDLEDYRDAKVKLFRQLGPGRKNRPKYGLVNGDDPYSGYFQQAAKVPVFTYSIQNPGDYQAVDLEISPKGAAFRLKGRSPLRLQLNLTGRFSIYNALAAVATALEEGVPLELIQEALAKFHGVPGRFELVDAGQEFTVVVDYAHTPDGLENVLQTAREISNGRVITVFGCGGDRDRTKRPLMGEAVARYSDFAIVTSDNPRTEDPEAIINDILPGLAGAEGRYQVVVDRKAGIHRALEVAKAGDLVVIAGKGHEDYQIIGKKKYPFDDRKVVKEFFGRE